MSQLNILYKHIIVDFNNLDETEKNLNIFLCEHDIVDVEEFDRSDNIIKYRIKYIISLKPNLNNNKVKNDDVIKQEKNGEKANYYNENDYLKKLDPIKGAYYRYAKDIRNLIAFVIKTRSSDLMTNYMIFDVINKYGEATIENLTKYNIIPDIFFNKLANFYVDVYENQKENILKQYLQNNTISSKLSNNKSEVEKYSIKYEKLIGCYKGFQMPLELIRYKG